MEKKPGTVLVGTAGWEHEEFDSVFYPEERMESGAKLAWYARTFDAVEVRCSFWDDLLTPEDAARAVSAVEGNGRFRFLVKLHRSFTHERAIHASATRAVRGFLQEFVRHDRLGALLMQFPQSFTATSSHRFHVVRLAEIFTGFPVHAEFRHDSWNQSWVAPFLSEHGLHTVNADFPRVNRLMPFHTTVVGDTAYIRLHGRNENGWLRGRWDERYNYLYNARELREISLRVNRLTGSCAQVYVICNTTPQGKSIATAVSLLAATREEKPVVPAKTLEAFPQLKSVALPEPAGLLFDPDIYRRAM